MYIHGENCAENEELISAYPLWYNKLPSPITNLYFNKKKKFQTEINFSVTKYVVGAVSVKL